jgi:hypothetical protein
VWLGVNVGALDETGILEFVEVVAFNVDVGNDGKAIVVVGATEDVIGVL